MKPVHIYVMTCEGRTKIGVAANPGKRRKQLEDGAGASVALHGWREAPTRAVAVATERALHRHFAHQRLLGEWFTTPPAVVLAALDAVRFPAIEQRSTIPDDPAPIDLVDLALRHLDACAKGLPLLPEVSAFRRSMISPSRSFTP